MRSRLLRVALTCGLAGAIAGCATEARTQAPATVPASEPAATTAVPSPGATVLATAAAAPFWTLVAALPVAGEAGIGWSQPTGFVVSGSGTEDGAWFWHSPDGSTWTRAEAVEGSLGARIRRLVAAGPGMVAVGAVNSRAAVWTTTDATTWTRVPDQKVFAPSGAGHCALTELGDVASSGTAIVAIETEWNGSCEQPARRSLLESADGISWRRVFSTSDPDVLIEGLAHGSSGFVGVGRPTFVSSDGLEWTKVKGQLLEDVSAFGEGYAGIAEESGVWWSATGKRWTPALTIDRPIDALGGFAQVGNSLVLAVTEFSAGGDGVQLWASTDGRDWAPLAADPLLDAARDTVMASDGRRLVMLGFVHEQHGQVLVTDQIR